MCVYECVKGGEHGDEKLVRYNYLCPLHHVMESIKKQNAKNIDASMPLCIDNCEDCPNRKYQLQTSRQWVHVVHEDIDQVSRDLSDFISEEVTRGTMRVIKNTALTLQVDITPKCCESGPYPPKKWGIKVLKRLWFEKIRTSTPAKRGGSQPLNLTYERFWTEVIPEKMYLAIRGLNTDRKHQRIPIDSVIGATVDSTMQICLALQSSYQKNHNKCQQPRGVSFDLYLSEEFVSSSESVHVQVTLTKNSNRLQSGQTNCDESSSYDTELHTDSARSSILVDTPNGRAHSNDTINHNTDGNTFGIFSFDVSPSGVTYASNFPYRAALKSEHEGDKKKRKEIKQKENTRKTPLIYVCIVYSHQNPKMQITKVNSFFFFFTYT
ncbi:hypothetical protein RFI_17899 [Reticulomyxa filosa]|uniref:Uncharacterized protein n=1 Tax=Reticulomyxa filosa TaxID=46433 RepID=X6N1Y8_RETFI|nr:hypothetical protein RFI_17899 [Reticulomyxa filosa]|eukprot:ETO19322.1 hypothetical protein RFI_17899 [Reticulomyxa filosa]